MFCLFRSDLEMRWDCCSTAPPTDKSLNQWHSAVTKALMSAAATLSSSVLDTTTTCKCSVNAKVPVVHTVDIIRERLRGRYVDVCPVWFGCRGGHGWAMMEGWHGGATGGRHWAGGLHSCGLLLLIGTVVTSREGKLERPMGRNYLNSRVQPVICSVLNMQEVQFMHNCHGWLKW